jgi:hypothetical protein
MFALVLEHQSNRPFPDFQGISRRLVYDSIFSRNGVSGKPGAIHMSVRASVCVTIVVLPV